MDSPGIVFGRAVNGLVEAVVAVVCSFIGKDFTQYNVTVTFLRITADILIYNVEGGKHDIESYACVIEFPPLQHKAICQDLVHSTFLTKQVQP